jgi:hypothetical protein
MRSAIYACLTLVQRLTQLIARSAKASRAVPADTLGKSDQNCCIAQIFTTLGNVLL